MNRTILRLSVRLVACAGALCAAALVDGCSSTKSFFFANTNQQAIQRDTIGADGAVRTFVQDPQFAVNGTVRLAAVESLGLVPVTIEVPAGELPSPFDVPRTLNVPPGFSVALYAHGLESPRDIVVREDGTIFYSDSRGGQVFALNSSGERTAIATGLRSPHGLEFHNGALYYTDETRVFRYTFTTPTSSSGTSTMITDRLPTAGMHYHRTIRWVPNDKKFYIAIGSVDNKNVPDNPETGTVMRMSESGGKPDVAVRGLRNTVGLDVHPVTGELWGIDEGTDWLAMDLPPEEVNILRTGRHYGWPFVYSRNFRDPDFMGPDTSRQPKAEPSTIDLQGHSTPADMMFYRSSSLGGDWQNSMLITYHGSRDRTPPTGFKVVRVRADQNGANAREADFVTGFLTPLGEEWGQPTGIAVAADGTTFYLTDDRAGAIYRIYRPLTPRR
jgi:glucose/arabinose dehydrogenase